MTLQVNTSILTDPTLHLATGFVIRFQLFICGFRARGRTLLESMIRNTGTMNMFVKYTRTFIFLIFNQSLRYFFQVTMYETTQSL